MEKAPFLAMMAIGTGEKGVEIREGKSMMGGRSEKEEGIAKRAWRRYSHCFDFRDIYPAHAFH